MLLWSPAVTLQIEPGASAHLLDAVLLREDGTRGSCNALGVDISLTSTTPGLTVTAQQALVDWLCSAPAIYAKGQLSRPSGALADAGTGSSDDVDLLLYFDGLTGRVARLTFTAPCSVRSRLAAFGR